MTDKLTFDVAFSRLINVEKGFTDDKADPGNWTSGRVGIGELKGTKFGIAANTYPDLDIKNLTLEQAKAIYLRDWWMRIGADVIDGAIVYQMWDFAVNAGMSTAKRLLQRIVGVADDGQIGEHTLAAVKAIDIDDVLFRFNASKIRYYTSLAKWSDFGKGWMNRTADNLDYCAKDNPDGLR